MRARMRGALQLLRGVVRSRVSRRGMGSSRSPLNLAEGVLKGNRIALSRAITLVESQATADQENACSLFEEMKRLQQLGTTDIGSDRKKFRVGITGPPGAGKSTFIAALGMYLVDQGHRVAVLAIDPSSSRTGGSLLGDKTRMQQLALESNAYIRPSPSSGHLGGIAQATAESASLCEAAGYDLTIIETVGVGQSETAVSEMVDAVVLLVPPANGDEIQGMKKGIVELADMIVVNKADGDLLKKARHTKVEYMHALQLLRPKYPFWKPRVLKCSSMPFEGMGHYDESVPKVWDNVCEFKQVLEEEGVLNSKRQSQRLQMMFNEIQNQFLSVLHSTSESADVKRIQELQDDVAQSRIAPRHAARQVVDLLFSRGSEPQL